MLSMLLPNPWVAAGAASRIPGLSDRCQEMPDGLKYLRFQIVHSSGYILLYMYAIVHY